MSSAVALRSIRERPILRLLPARQLRAQLRVVPRQGFTPLVEATTEKRETMKQAVFEGVNGLEFWLQRQGFARSDAQEIVERLSALLEREERMKQ